MIQNTIFTSRKIPYNTSFPYIPPSAYTSNVKSTATNPGFPLSSPYINNAVYSYTNTNAGNKSQIGVFLENIGLSTGSSLPLSYCEIKIGNNGVPNFNVFDYLQTGIYAINANLTCVNNVFQNAAPVGKGSAVGKGIYAVITSTPSLPPMNARIRIIPGTPTGLFNNQFFDLSRAIETVNYFEHDIRKCNIRSTQIDPSPLSSAPLHTGEYGILIHTNRYYSLNVSQNTLYNIENGIVFNAAFGNLSIPGYSPSANAQYSGQADINNNTIQPHLPGYTITNQYVSNAIYVANTLPFGVPYINASASININANTIQNAYRGIFVANFHKKTVHTISNCITIKTEPSLLPAPLQFGIHRVNMIGGNLLGNNILNNDVTGANTTNPNMIGIYIKQAVNEKVSCNTINNNFYDAVFDGVSSPCAYLGNKMNGYSTGLLIRNAAVLGPQGTSTAPSDNMWLMPCPPTRIDAIGAPAASSPFYVRTSPPAFNPGLNLCSSVYSFSVGTLISANGPYYSCPNVSPCGNTIPTPLISAPSNTLPAVQLLEKIAQNLLPANPAMQWMNKHYLYRMLESDASLKTNSPILNNFFNTQITSSNQQISDIETDIFNGNLSAAQSKILALSPQNNIESNIKTYYQIYLNYINTAHINSADSTILYNMASGCPHTDGNVIHLARALYNAYYQKIIWWDDNCSNNNRLWNSPASFNNNLNSDDEIKLFPVPAKDELFIECTNSEIVNVQIMDMTGKLLNETTPDVPVKKFKIHLPLSRGIYLINIQTHSYSFRKKLIVE